MKINDTIAAAATPVGEGGIGIIRVSGDEAIFIADKIYRGKKVCRKLKVIQLITGI